MSNIPDVIRNTYLARFDELELEYQLHFASRLYAWNGDLLAVEKLRTLRPAIVLADSRSRLANLRGIKDELLVKDYERDINNYKARKPFFDTYPDLLFLHNALFRIRHWYCIYGVDDRSLLFKIISKNKVDDLLSALKNNQEAIRVLSTYAVNTFYLYDELYGKETNLDPNEFLRLGTQYDKTDIKQLQMLVYLYTHCIIGKTLFYYQPIDSHGDVYKHMLEEIEQFTRDHFDNINLDNKLEFLVCAQLCNFTSGIQSRIYEEVTQSMHEEGFIIDRLNKNINPVKQTFLMSEHRNVLYLMSLTAPRFVTESIR